MRRHIILFAALCLVGPVWSATGTTAIKTATYERLDSIREDKRQQLLDYIAGITALAESAARDEVMLDFFRIKGRYFRLQRTTPPPPDLERRIEDLKTGIRDHYLRHYLSFYDILFVNQAGDIFHTIRRQDDYHKNLFEGELARTSLSRQLGEHPNSRFVDFEYYAVSDEPSAFLVEPIRSGGVLEGWLVLQCSINKINNMFTEGQGLGETGEVFLVNREQYLLTESRFSKEPSILNLHLSRKNIEAKFGEGAGHKIVTDYRGHRALSSFEVCQIGNGEWLLIAKIDEAEIITEQYRKHRAEIRADLATRLRALPPQPSAPLRIESEVAVVDIDEFRKATGSELLCTYGVSTCTALVVSLPGQFAYLGHISNRDVVYGGTSTDLVRHIFKRIHAFDIYDYQRRALHATIIANHVHSAVGIIDRLVDEGLLLSQITFLTAESAYGNIIHDYREDRTLVEWTVQDDGEATRILRHGASGAPSVGSVVEDLLGYDK